MPLDKLAPANEGEARQRLMAVVEQQQGRIGRIRTILQQIADADQAEAPVRLAFETGTEGDRKRRYVLSYERLVNRRIDTFLEVRKASGSGELNLVELPETLGTEQFQDLTKAAGLMVDGDPGDLRSGNGRGQDTVAQQPPDPFAGSARVSDPAETPDRRIPVLASTIDRATAESTETMETFGRVPGRGQETCAQLADADTRGQFSDVSHIGEETCYEDTFLRNEPNAAVCAGAGGQDGTVCQREVCGDNVEIGQTFTTVTMVETVQIDPGPSTAIIAAKAAEAEPGSEDVGRELAARATDEVETALAQPDAIATPVCAPEDDLVPKLAETADGQATCGSEAFLRNEARDAPNDPHCLESDGPAGAAVIVASEENAAAAAEGVDRGGSETTDFAPERMGNRAGLQESVRPGAERPPPVVASVIRGPTAELRAALALLSHEEILARRWAMFQARRR